MKGAKLRSIVLTGLMLLVVSGSVFAQVIDRAAATVNLTKNEFISVLQVEQRIRQYQQLIAQGITGIPTEPMKVLDLMIQEVLIRQAAEEAVEKGQIQVSSQMIDAQIDAVRKDLDRQQGSPVTDRQFEEVVLRETGLTIEAYKKQIRDQFITQEYIKLAKQNIFANITGPTEKQIEDQYRRNATSFTNPELVRISEVYISTRELTTAENRRKALERAEGALREIRNSNKPFEEAVLNYTDDMQTKYSGGDKGFFARNDPRTQAYGSDYIEALFDLEVGEISDVIQSRIGYHIVKVTDHRNPKLLSLDDPINPLESQTVRAFIRELLTQEIQNQALQRAIEELTQELEERAEIRIFEENIK